MHVQGVGVGHLEDGQKDGIVAVEVETLTILIFGAQLDAGHVLEAEDSAIGRVAQDDVLELLDLGQPAERVQGDLHLLPLVHGLLADGAGGDRRRSVRAEPEPRPRR